MRVLAVALVIAGTTPPAQSEPAFDVVAIKPNTSLAESGGGGPLRGGRYRLRNISTRQLIGAAPEIWTSTLGAETPPGDAVSIFTALQEQLGLKLESGTAPLDVIVIERIERPTANQKDQEGAPDKARPTTDYRLPTTDYRLPTKTEYRRR